MKKITISIDRKKVSCMEGEPILPVALKNNIPIPHFCFHEDLPVEANCRTCLVEDMISGRITTSCTLRAQDTMVLKTKGNKLAKLRTQNLMLLFAGHKKNCPLCQKKEFCKVCDALKQYQVTTKEYDKKTTNQLPYHHANAVVFNRSLCINCNKCVQVCEKVGIGFLSMQGKGVESHIEQSKDPQIDCIYCGQCSVHCPSGAMRELYERDDVEKILKNKTFITVAQMAPSVRASIGEEFGVAPGVDLSGQMYTALRMLGFNKIFDVNMGADITTLVEAHELVQRIKGKKVLPLFTSCCPSWVKFVEFYYPRFIPHLATSRSPQIHAGAAYKTWWAKKNNIDPRNIKVVSIMPCTSKKYEAKNAKFKINGLFPVDYVLTTREMAQMLKTHSINLPHLPASKVDVEGNYSGAAAIYGASGGVAESALRTVAYLLGHDLKSIEFEDVRGIQGIKKAEVVINGITLHIAVVSTMKNARIILEELVKNPKAYDYVEFMACPGGCMAGGGQPIPTTQKITEKRIKGLYALDKKSSIRKAHENPVVKDFFSFLETLPKDMQHNILHTSYIKKCKEV